MKINYKGNIDLTIGAGGRAMNQLIHDLMLAEFDNEFLAQQGDQAILPPANGKLAFSTDSYVVSPLFFNGGDIGSLAINGTVNDLAVGGAIPLYIAAGFIIEEGFPLAQLREIVKSMANAAKTANVKIVTGDTKVVEKGKGDGIFINTSGIGVVENDWVATSPQDDDLVIINGAIGDHGMAIMSKRQGLNFASDISSDCAALNSLITSLAPYQKHIKVMRDPTRGGVSAVLNEWATFYNCSFEIDEEKLLINESVRGLSEILGLDPLHIANEGKVMLVVAKDYAEEICTLMKNHPLGQESRIIAKVNPANQVKVSMKTLFGGLRRVDWLNGEQLPRIC